MSTLFERLGRTEGIQQLVESVVTAHLDNPAIAKRYTLLAEDPERMKAAGQHLCDFLEEGAGGPAKYVGRSMPDIHRGMNISGEEYLATVDDIMGALAKHGRDEATQKDVLHMLYSIKGQIMRQ